VLEPQRYDDVLANQLVIRLPPQHLCDPAEDDETDIVVGEPGTQRHLLSKPGYDVTHIQLDAVVTAGRRCERVT
jgi:hypothetical protein